MKSTLTSVFWPAWEWGPRDMQHIRMIGASHEQGLAVRDTRKMRNLIMSDWYQERWPTALVSDQNQKTFYENDKTGWRQACAVASMTGKRGDRVVWDDPHSVEASLSVAHRETALRVFQETLPTRLNNPDKSAIVIVMQRLHENDVSGFILEDDYGYDHLCLPMEYEKDRHCITSIGFSDPRKEEGELLFPERFSRETVDRDKKVMGTMAVAGQFQQRPAPRTGGFFAWQNIEIVKSAPKLRKIVRYWDKAGTDAGGAYTAGVKMGIGFDNNYYVLDVVRGQWSAAPREKTIKSVAQLDGLSVEIWIEQEPGSGGKESSEATIKNLSGYNIKSERATGDKAVRAEPYAVQVEAGSIKIIEADWNQAFIDEHKTFPVGKYKDQIDASGGGFNKLASGYSLSAWG
jgi:predicted phage terminase large subunit-like protein